MSKPVIQCVDLNKTFKDAGKPVDVFVNLNLELAAGECIAIIGRSGAGKSTLLHLLGGLDKPTSGSVLINGQDFKKLSEKQKSMLRNKSLGFIYQFHHLLPEFTAVENVCIPLVMGGADIVYAENKAKMILSKAGLAERLQHKVAQLSGGERQRVAIARSLVTEPLCVLADEPTGNLDSQTADQVFAMMLNLNKELDTSLVIVTHDEQLAAKMDKTYLLENGQLTLI
jgi:lipoprotein-releasing system ATP-binding protein